MMMVEEEGVEPLAFLGAVSKVDLILQSLLLAFLMVLPLLLGLGKAMVGEAVEVQAHQ